VRLTELQKRVNLQYWCRVCIMEGVKESKMLQKVLTVSITMCRRWKIFELQSQCQTKIKFKKLYCSCIRHGLQ